MVDILNTRRFMYDVEFLVVINGVKTWVNRCELETLRND